MNLTDEVVQYHEQALSDTWAMNYLTSERGLTPTTIKRFKLGLISDPLSLEARGFKGSIVIPYLTLTGKVISAKLRLFKSKRKYLPLRTDFPLSSPKVHLFNAHRAMPTVNRNTVYLVEGEFDAIVADQCGLKAVAIPGVDSFHEAWSHLFASADVRVTFDGDDAGKRAAAKLTGLLGKRRITARVVPLPEGQDLTDILLARGKSGVLDALGATVR